METVNLEGSKPVDPDDLFIAVMDTPGFNDSRRPDGETLQELAYWLAAAYERKIKLSGIVYLHRITDNRFQGSAVRALSAFKSMCGEEAFCGVVVATTMWDRATKDELVKAELRHEELREKIQDVIQHGGNLRELVDENRLIHETRAGQVLFEDLTDAFKTLQAKVDDARCRLAKMARCSRRDELHELEDAITEMAGDMRSVDEDIERTKVDLSDIRSVWDRNLARDDGTIMASAQRIERQLEHERIQQEVRSVAQTASTDGGYETSSVGLSSANTLQTSQTYMSLRLEELEKERDALTYQMGQRLNRRYTAAHGRGATRIGAIGAGLAVAQLVVAMACTVM
ncbi:hypothetical protein J4E83_010516 [Alternaria metachromatica]|uniref:uncharacterized protein n=1 Tax=Alternaria metachromatica TaxID=283354 RepID=UPI0020C4C62C|nr:uncharacterized protein J4E83_010516 [Alternaria metachromatica]KAI4605624.1 hypothetical protein J4E83_010516 [Alternaria metachromatica]